ncbi:MAG: hypothetical protein H8D22_01035 [Candidatus Cloacimonetes bacterium]|nr:hypothetical protein [Candidatus Cloacimonadota bacterium]
MKGLNDCVYTHVGYHIMKDNDYDIRECFAYFGLTIYMVQTVEKGILNSLILSYKNITKTRYDELFAEKSQLTFGQLKREIIEKGIFNNEIVEKIDKFHEKRDWLAHNYWWDRSIEFYRDNLKYKILEELDKLTTDLEDFNNIIKESNRQFLIKKGLDPDKLFEEFASFDKTPYIPTFKKLSKNETLIGIYLFEPEKGFQIPIFKLEDNTYWTLCESGLTSFNVTEIEKELLPLDKTIGIFPVTQFNPKPKILKEWDYEINLKKNGLYIKVQPTEINGKFVFNWTIKKHGS